MTRVLSRQKCSLAAEGILGAIPWGEHDYGEKFWGALHDFFNSLAGGYGRPAAQRHLDAALLKVAEGIKEREDR